MPSNINATFETLHEIVKTAHMNLARGDWDYLVGATETETTMRRNRLALDKVGFRPRVLRDVAGVDPSATLLGRKLRLPLLLAPIGSVENFTPGGGATAAQAADAFGVAHMLSSVCNPGMEAVAQAANNLRIFQLYVRGDRDWVDETARRAIQHGYSAFCLTVDTAWYSRRERDIIKRFVKPWRQGADATDFQQRLNWDDVRHFKETHDIPLILKGIATAEDAQQAVEMGVEWVYVSNHGGRQLDHGVGGLEVLREVAAAVRGKAGIMYDGAIMRGTDVVKAIATGADCVGIGRLQCLGLAAGGQAGLERALELLEDEVKICLGLLGVRGWEELDATYLREADVVTTPHVLSAFPHLHLDESPY